MFETVGYDTKSKSLNFWLCLLRSASIGENPGQIDDFCEPTAVFLLFNLHTKVHGQMLRLSAALEKNRSRAAWSPVVMFMA